MAKGATSYACMPKCIPEAPLPAAFLDPLLRFPLGAEVGEALTVVFEGGAATTGPSRANRGS